LKSFKINLIVVGFTLKLHFACKVSNLPVKSKILGGDRVSYFHQEHKMYYNFIKPHENLNGYTPAHFANIYLKLENKKWENLLIQSIKSIKKN